MNGESRMKPGRIIDLYLQLHEQRMSPPSPSGMQLDKLRLELPSAHPSGEAEQERQLLFAHAVYSVLALLSDEERRVVLAMRTPLPHHPQCPATHLRPYNREADCDCGALQVCRKDVREGDLTIHEVRHPDGTVDRWQQTHQGERVVGAATNAAGEPLDGWVRVEGVRPVYPTREQVAERHGLTFDAVKRLIRTAYAKINKHHETAREAEEGSW